MGEDQCFLLLLNLRAFRVSMLLKIVLIKRVYFIYLFHKETSVYFSKNYGCINKFRMGTFLIKDYARMREI